MCIELAALIVAVKCAKMFGAWQVTDLDRFRIVPLLDSGDADFLTTALAFRFAVLPSLDRTQQFQPP